MSAVTVDSRKRTDVAIKSEADDHLRRMVAITGRIRPRRPQEPGFGPHEEAVAAKPEALPHWNATKAAWWELATRHPRAAMAVARKAEQVAPDRFGRGDFDAVAWMGMFHAAAVWDSSKTPSFDRFAYRSAWGWCRRSMTQGQPVHTSNGDTYRRITLGKWLKEGRSFADAAERVGMDVDSAGLLWTMSDSPKCLDAPVGDGSARLSDMIAAPAIMGNDHRIDLKTALTALPDQDQVWFGNVLQGMGVFNGARAAGYHVSEQRITERWTRLKHTIRVKMGSCEPLKRFSTVAAIDMCSVRPRTTREIADALGASADSVRKALSRSRRFYRNGDVWEVDDE